MHKCPIYLGTGIEIKILVFRAKKSLFYYKISTQIIASSFHFLGARGELYDKRMDKEERGSNKIHDKRRRAVKGCKNRRIETKL
jgi:hypothetical protein